MREIKYADAGMDMKRLALCLAGKLWAVLLAAALGAVCGGVIYGLCRIVPESEREYRGMSKVYLDFAPDKTGEVYQAYNGYTWNDLMATDPILDGTMAHLPEGFSREEAAAAVKAEILSDVRLLTITVTTHDADSCNAILHAAGQSLVEHGDAAKEFEQIRVIQTREAALVTADSRMAQAVLVGAAVTAVFALLGMMLCYVLDDRILVAGDLKQVTDVSFIGYDGAPGRLGRDYEENLAYLRRRFGEVWVLPVAQGDILGEDEAREEDARRQDTAGRTAGQAGGPSAGRSETDAREQPGWRQEPGGGQNVVLVAEYGKVHAAYLAYVIEQLRLRDGKLCGVAIGGANVRFLRSYYGAAAGGRKNGKLGE